MLGEAGVAIGCDVAFDVRGEFDDWHAHEGSGYFILYEAQKEAAINAGP